MNKIFYTILGFFFPYKTKAYRKELYGRMREFYNGHRLGLCETAQRIEYVKVQWSWYDNMWRLPELYRYRPWIQSKSDFWFPLDVDGFSKRVDILDKIKA
jgi:hypothetical protein